MLELQLKITILVLFTAALRKTIVLKLSPMLCELLWLLFAIRLWLPDDFGIALPVQGALTSTGSVPVNWRKIKVIVFLSLLLLLAAFYCLFAWRLRTKRRIAVVSAGTAVYQTTAVKGPMVCGLFVPKIIVPSNAYTVFQYACILRHEQAHIQRGDLWKKRFMVLTTLWNWWNPACWLMLSLFCRDLELACDHWALRKSTRVERAGYAHTLLLFHAQNLGAFAVGFQSGAVQERIEAIMNPYKKKLSRYICFVLFVLCALLASFLKPQAAAAETRVPDLTGQTAYAAENILQENGYAVYSEAVYEN